MVKLTVFHKRAPGLSVAAFQRRHLSDFRAAAARLPGVQRFVQSNTLESGYGKGEPLYDAVDELWFAGEHDARAARDAPELDAMRLHHTVDPQSFATILTTEHVAKDGPVPDGGVKSIEFVTRSSTLPLEEFQRYWREVHGPLAAKIPMIRRYVQSHCLPSGYAGGARPAWDGVAITWFESTAEMRRSALTAELAATREDEANFLAPGHLPFIITTEHVVSDGGGSSAQR